jgi:PiT family inorganic phosphate transporter
MGMAWLITLPSAAVVSAVMWYIGHMIGGTIGAFVVFGIMCVGALLMRWKSRRDPISHENVNDDWDGNAEQSKIRVSGGVK